MSATRPRSFRDAACSNLAVICVMISSRPTNSESLWKGTVEEGLGMCGVCADLSVNENNKY